MKVYDTIFCADDAQDRPAWVAVKLSECDEANIKLTAGLFTDHPHMHSVVLYLQGSFDFEGEYPLHSPLIEIDRDGNKYLTLQHRYGADVQVDLDYAESTEYVWDGEKVVEVDHGD